MERKVKGSLVKIIVKGIRADKINKDKYDNLLSDDAKDLLNQRVLDSNWYPFDIYFEIYYALTKVFAKNSRQLLIKWGHQFGENVMTSIYKNLIVEGNVDKLVKMYPRFHRLLFNFGKLTLEKISKNEVIITYSDFAPKFEFWYYTSLGWLQKSFEMCLKKTVKYEILKRSWKGDDVTQYKMTWTPWLK